ncbi:IclR family pca regulon transcriptional regulator [Bacillus pakistanensis]|uniref:IclR family pca regulon transcriptional regulator n=1 Tax=Rossellomorea pakistanensis TaxID=992288 RepID=A0ABS2NE66_9BACI|nr:IclR family transcriptional regulator C-terminal domain-containing protein [Bacillus pakistanensis]MBM7586105.1 IclR family pca regulon transcriptional regulator [Bacillus pakistanensis]
MTNVNNNSNYFVQSVAKGFEVLKAFDARSSTLSLGELAQKTGINKATVRRFALTLVDLGYLNLMNDNRFQLSPKVLDLGHHFIESLNLPDLVLPILESMATKLKESTNLAVLDGSEVVYVARVNAAERIVGANLRVGSRLPFYATSLGKALVAWIPATYRRQIWENTNIEAFTEKTLVTFEKFEENLSKCRLQGFAYGDGELDEGLRSIAMPIFNRKGETIAAMNISTHTLRTTKESIFETYLPVLKEGAEKLNRQTAYQG